MKLTRRGLIGRIGAAAAVAALAPTVTETTEATFAPGTDVTQVFDVAPHFDVRGDSVLHVQGHESFENALTVAGDVVIRGNLRVIREDGSEVLTVDTSLLT